MRPDKRRAPALELPQSIMTDGKGIKSTGRAVLAALGLARRERRSDDLSSYTDDDYYLPSSSDKDERETRRTRQIHRAPASKQRRLGVTDISNEDDQTLNDVLRTYLQEKSARIDGFNRRQEVNSTSCSSSSSQRPPSLGQVPRGSTDCPPPQTNLSRQTTPLSAEYSPQLPNERPGPYQQPTHEGLGNWEYQVPSSTLLPLKRPARKTSSRCSSPLPSERPSHYATYKSRRFSLIPASFSLRSLSSSAKDPSSETEPEMSQVNDFPQPPSSRGQPRMQVAMVKGPRRTTSYGTEESMSLGPDGQNERMRNYGRQQPPTQRMNNSRPDEQQSYNASYRPGNFSPPLLPDSSSPHAPQNPCEWPPPPPPPSTPPMWPSQTSTGADDRAYGPLEGPSCQERILNVVPESRRRSLSRKRIAQKVSEKLDMPREPSIKKSNETTRRVVPVLRRRTAPLPRQLHDPRSQAQPESLPDIPIHRSRKSSPIRSGTNKSSINNPKLLEQVEDAIKRLILPELKALKEEEQNSMSQRNKHSSNRQTDGSVEYERPSKDETVVRKTRKQERRRRPEFGLPAAAAPDGYEVRRRGRRKQRASAQQSLHGETPPLLEPSGLMPSDLHDQCEVRLNNEYKSILDERGPLDMRPPLDVHGGTSQKYPIAPPLQTLPLNTPPALPITELSFPEVTVSEQIHSRVEISDTPISQSNEPPELYIEAETIELHKVYSAKADVPYKHLDYLGKGTFGWVDKVAHRTTNLRQKYYARKVIEASNWNSSQELEVIQNEVSIIKRLKHKHMARLVCTYQFEKQFCIIMLPVAECHLADFLFKLEKNLDIEDREKALQQIWGWYGCLADALNYLHEKKVKHKDIKPANILVKGNKIYITDFGIAKDMVDSETTASIGTQGARSPMYCAPEVYFEGYRRGRKADIFSLGCVFLEMTTILSDASLERFNSFRRQKGTDKRAYSVNPDKVLQWIAYLNVRTATARSATAPQAACALYWAFLMLDPEADLRPSSQELLKGMRTNYSDVPATGCSSCGDLLGTKSLPTTLPKGLLDLATDTDEEYVLNGTFEMTWDQARSKCLDREIWLAMSESPQPMLPLTTSLPHSIEFDQPQNQPGPCELIPRGLDKIRSKDLVALMNHLTIRDAQRNARDTEILVTMMRSAAEVRNSYEDIKRYLAEQDALIPGLEDSRQNESDTVLGGPELTSSQKPKSTNMTNDLNNLDVATKRKNVFKRALKGLNGKGSNDLAVIEQMLVQLLGDIECLKDGQALTSGGFNGSDTSRYPALSFPSHSGGLDPLAPSNALEPSSLPEPSSLYTKSKRNRRTRSPADVPPPVPPK